MKGAFFLIPIAVALTSKVSHAQSLPNTLICKGIRCEKSEADFCQLETYAHVQIEGIVTGDLRWQDASGSPSVKKGRVVLDFSEGDQYSFFAFKWADLAKLASGRLKSVKATYTDAYRWVDGYHVRQLVRLECQVKGPGTKRYQ